MAHIINKRERENNPKAEGLEYPRPKISTIKDIPLFIINHEGLKLEKNFCPVKYMFLGPLNPFA